MRSSTSLLNITLTHSKTWRQSVTTISRAVATTLAQAQMTHLPKKRSTWESDLSLLIRAWRKRSRIKWQGRRAPRKRSKQPQVALKKGSTRLRRPSEERQARPRNRNLKTCKTKSQTRDWRAWRKCTRSWLRLRQRPLLAWYDGRSSSAQQIYAEFSKKVKEFKQLGTTLAAAKHEYWHYFMWAR